MTLLLNSLLRLGLQTYKNNGVMVWTMDILGPSPKCKYLYRGYFPEEADNRLKDNIGFTSFTDIEKNEEKDANLYYSTRGISSEDCKTFIPSNLTDSTLPVNI